MHLAARQGEIESVKALLDAGADINQRGAGDPVTPLLIATMNGHFDLAKMLLDKGADPNLAQSNGVTPLYAALGCQWSDKALYPQPRAFEQQKTSYLDLMQALLEKGANPNARLTRSSGGSPGRPKRSMSARLMRTLWRPVLPASLTSTSQSQPWDVGADSTVITSRILQLHHA